MPPWIESLVMQQDYFWFLAGLSLLAALLVGWRQGGPAWLPWVTAGSLAMVVAELWSLTQPVTGDAYHPLNLSLDLLLGFILAVQTWALGRGRKRGGLAWLALGLALGVAWLRRDFPWSATLALDVAATAALWWPGRAADRPVDSWLRWGTALALWFSPIGAATVALNNWFIGRLAPAVVSNAPLGSITALTVGLRRWNGPGAWGVWASALLFLAGLIYIWRQVRRLPPQPDQREWRRFGGLAALWLVAGLFMAASMGGRARRIFEESALSRARLAAQWLSAPDLAAAFGPRFDPQPLSAAAGSTPDKARVAPAFQTAVRPIRHQLALIEDASPAGTVALLLVGRNGWNTVAAFSETKPFLPEFVTILGPAEPEPARSPIVRYLPPYQEVYGTVTQARAQVFFPDGRFLGWLALEIDPQEWLAAQLQSRLQAFAIVGLGLGLAYLGLRQRLKVFERDKAVEADRMKTEFLARVSHELRTPIQSVLGYGELLQSAVEGPAARSRLAALRQHGQLMLRLVNDLLDLSALQCGRFRLSPRPTLVAELVRQTVESLRPRAAAKGLAFQVEIPDLADGWVRADGERLRQVVLNLVANAVKFTDQGSIRVAFFRDESSRDLVLQVQDTGPGIPPQRRRDLFQSFVRLEATAGKEGTGLGLALALALCRSMGGDLVLDDSPGSGASFSARFQLASCAPPVERDAPPPRSLAGRSILIVDDNTLIRELFSTFLQELGAQCTVAMDGPGALQLARAQAYDAVVLDLALPGMTGGEVARLLRLSCATRLRIVGVSAHAGEAERREALAAGMDCFLLKPVELHALATELAAPASDNSRPVPSLAGLNERLRAQFRSEAAEIEAALVAAMAETDWPMVQAKAHYLKNSADVLGLAELAEACRELEEAAGHRHTPRAHAAIADCRTQLMPWH